MFQDLAPGGINNLPDFLTDCPCQSLISLAVVISAHIKEMMVILVIPLHIFNDIFRSLCFLFMKRGVKM